MTALFVRGQIKKKEENCSMKKILILASTLVFMFALMTSAFAGLNDPNWSDINDIVPAPGNSRPGNVAITEDLTGYPASTDAGSPYAIGYVGHSSDTYCNQNRHIVFYNWVSVAQWLRVKAENIDRHIMIRKPGIYTFADKPMQVRLASNGDVLVNFQELWGDGNWNAKWYEYTFYPGGVPSTPWDKSYPRLAEELVPQIPVDKQYQVTVYGEVDADPPTGFVETPAGDGVIKFLNSQRLHELNNPVNGFDMQIREIVAPCNTTGDYVLKARIIFRCYNQMWYIDPATGAIDGTRDATFMPPAPYLGM